MLKIYGRATSSNVQAVMWAIGEFGIEHQRMDVGGNFGRNDTSEFLAMNPMGRVPVMQDGTLTLFESQAILRYLAAKYRTNGFWPADPASRAKIDQWMEWAKINFYPILTLKIFWQLIRITSSDRNNELVLEGQSELVDLMSIADTQISKEGWLAGPEMTLADISFGTHLYRYFNLPFERANLPNLQNYYEKLCGREAYQKHAMVSFEPLRVPGA